MISRARLRSEGGQLVNEAARLERNRQRLTECWPSFSSAVRRVLDALEAQGFRPRIQDAWRSEEDQAKAVAGGFSDVFFGFHNVTGAGGRKEALACDVLDDDNPEGTPPKRYLLALAVAARAHGLETLIFKGLDKSEKATVEAAIAAGDIDRNVKLGNDPTHVQPTDITIAEAKAGKRPGGASLSASTISPPPEVFMALTDTEQRELVNRIRAMHIGNWVDSGTNQGDLTWLARIVGEQLAPLAAKQQALEAALSNLAANQASDRQALARIVREQSEAAVRAVIGSNPAPTG